MAFDSTVTLHGGVGERESRAFERALERLSGVVAEAAGRERSWLARVRAGLVAFLGFFDDEPGWGRLLIDGAAVRETAGLGRERRVLGVLSGLLDDGRSHALGELRPDPQLTGELLAGGVVSVLRTCMLEGEEQRLVELAPDLMVLITTPFMGQRAAAELASPAVAAGEQRLPVDALERRAPLASPVRVTRRTLSVLRAICSAPRSSNRAIARATGLSDEGQTSRLLNRLKAHGLIQNTSAAHGEPNAWLLTIHGRRVLARAERPARTGSPRPGTASSSSSNEGRAA